MCHEVKTVNPLDEFYLVYPISHEVSGYILGLVNKFAIMPAFQAIFLPHLSLAFAASANSVIVT